jgi:hypothetical protein
VRRDGTLQVDAAKFPDKKTRLIPYVFNTEQAYMCEFGDLYVRIFYPDGTYTGVELVSPYSHDVLERTDYVQGADTMFIFNAQVPTHRLRRLADTEWSLAPAPFVTNPFDEKGIDFTSAITFSTPTVGTGRTATAVASAFLASDVGREIWSGGGVAKITGVTSATVATVDILNAFTAAVQRQWWQQSK